MHETSLMASIAATRDQLPARQTADLICHLLREFIPERCFHEARAHVAEAFHKAGMEITSKEMRKEYEAAKLTQLERPNPPITTPL